jgi:AcrR family transcriptional regulator
METVDFEPDEFDTRTKLILAAERLFGERGIDAVSLREVVVAAGQRNASALNYHVGGREELILAILDFRRASVDARRVTLLDEYAVSDIEVDEAMIAAGVIVPLTELMLSDPRGGNYLRFLSQAYVTERPASAYRATGETDQGMRRCHRLYRACHPGVASRLITERFATCCRGAVYALADWQRDAMVPRSNFPRSSLSVFSADLVTLTASGLASVRDRRCRFGPFAAPPNNVRGTAEREAS